MRWLAILGVLLMIAPANAFGDDAESTPPTTQVIVPDCGPDPQRLVPVPDPIGGRGGSLLAGHAGQAPVDLYQLVTKMEAVLATVGRQTASLSVAELTEAFLKWDKANNTPGTSTERARLLRNWLRAKISDEDPRTFQELRTNELDATTVRTWVNSHDTWGPTTRSITIRDIKRVFNWAVDEELLEVSPIRRLKKPEPNSREEWINEDDYKLIMATVHDVPFRDLLTMAWETGGRPFELYRVEARHVRLDERCIVFPKEESKGKKRERRVWLSGVALAIVQRLVLMYPQGPLLRNSKGMPWTNASVNNRFRNRSQELGRKFTQYQFRHGFATRLLMEGNDSLVVAKAMGHVDTKMINRVYVHLEGANLLQVVNGKPIGGAIRQPG